MHLYLEGAPSAAHTARFRSTAAETGNAPLQPWLLPPMLTEN